MNLKETTEAMNIEDYQERFVTEYFQLSIRIDALKAMLKKYKNKELDFKPLCSYTFLHNQLIAMGVYQKFLERRAVIEKICLSAKVVD